MESCFVHPFAPCLAYMCMDIDIGIGIDRHTQTGAHTCSHILNSAGFRLSLVHKKNQQKSQGSSYLTGTKITATERIFQKDLREV